MQNIDEQRCDGSIFLLMDEFIGLKINNKTFTRFVMKCNFELHVYLQVQPRKTIDSHKKNLTFLTECQGILKLL